MVGEPFPAVLRDRRICAVERIRQFLRFSLEGDLVLVVNAMLTGRYRWVATGQQRKGKTASKDLILALRFDDGSELHYLDETRMGKIYVARAHQLGDIPGFSVLGVDLLSSVFTLEHFRTLAANRRDQVRYAGIGLETTRVLSEAGATVVVPARTLDKARAAVAGMALVEVDSLDLGDPASVDAFANRFLASGRPLHLLINNAGIMATPLLRDRRGFESQLATNHLGHFQLTLRLWPALRAAQGARVVALSSRGHRRSGVDFDDPHFQRRPYDKWIAYGQSKTANALFAMALDVRGQAHHVRAFSVHPGAVLTDIVRSMTAEEVRDIRARIESAAPKDTPAFKNTEQAAATTTWCATSPQLDGMGGVYCEDVDIAEAVAADFPEARGVRPWAMDPALAEQLWQASEQWAGIGLD